MVLEEQSCSGSFARPLLQTLPTEILHLVFDQLSLHDVLTARKTCSILAHVGIDHFGDEIPLVYHRDKFRALCEIAEHPEISKRMRSLFYRSDRCGWAPYEVWDGLRRDPQPKKETTAWAGHSRTDPGRRSQAVMARINGVPESDRQKGYRAFEALCRDTAEVYETGYDLACLRLLFEGCPKLREVTIASHIGCDRRLKAEFTAFSDAMTVLDEDWTRVYAGVHQVLTVATAVQYSGIALDSLTMSHISQELFAMSNPALRALVRPLRRLRMAIHTLHSREGGDSAVTIIADDSDDNDDDVDNEDEGIDDNDGDEEVEDEGSDDNDSDVDHETERIRDPQYDVRMTHLREFLAEARDLRVLSLQLALNNVRTTFSGGARLKDAIGDTVYPHLYELSISECNVEAGYLVDLILRHKATLRRLYLSNLQLTAKGRTNWRTVFTMLSAQLPNLRVVRLTGGFLRNRCSDDALPGDPFMTRSYTDSLEDFIIHGGIWPTKSSQVVRPEGSDELSDDCMELDDPARDYDHDEFDV
jgi:hypothetical protein